MKKQTIKRIILLVVAIVVIGATMFIWQRLPIITAFASKGMCSSVFLADKTPEQVMLEDLSFFPISLAKSKVNYEEKSVSSTVFGIAKRKAIYRQGLGAVIVLNTPEEELKAQSFTKSSPGYSQDTIPWPLGDVLPDSVVNGIDYDRLENLLDTCFDKAGEEPYKKTLGIAVVYDNHLLSERYLAGYDMYTKFHGWSMTKSITGALAGILVDAGEMALDDPVNIDEWKDDKRASMTLRNVIQMSSGLDWFENYFTISDATVMLMQSDDMFASVVGTDLAYDPGTYWNYSSGDANLLSGLVREVMNDEDAYHALAYDKLFHRIGMLNTEVETDASGLFVASSYSYGSTRDWARFGMLFLNEGIFEGDTILSKDWVEFMKEPASTSAGNYAGTFWLKEPNEANELKDIPEDVFFADGFLGQRVYVIPSKKLVVVRMGYSLTNFNTNDFLREVIKTLPE